MIESALSVFRDRPVLLLLLLLAILAVGRQVYVRTVQRARRQERRLRVGKITRRYILRLPANLSTRDDWRVMIVYHPALGTGEFMERITRLHALPGSESFIVAYPAGIARTWNAGACCGIAKKKQIDDLGFFDAMMTDISRRAGIRPKAYVTGFSNGALMVYHLVCNRADRIGGGGAIRRLSAAARSQGGAPRGGAAAAPAWRSG